jgi:hypothetical protein
MDINPETFSELQRQNGTLENSHRHGMKHSENPNNWARGFNRDQVFESLVFSYVVKVEDEYTRHGELCGVYNFATENGYQPKKGTKDNSVFREFMRYVRLAKRRGALPDWWTDQDHEDCGTYAADDGHIYLGVEAQDVDKKFPPIGSMMFRMIADNIVHQKRPGGDWFSEQDYSEQEEEEDASDASDASDDDPL